MKNTMLHYNRPAKEWIEALPLGNGRIGAMIYGTVGCERLQFNEETLWSGWRDDFADNPESRAHLDEIRRLLFTGKNAEAEELASKYMVCRGDGSGHGHGREYAYGSFETAGELYIKLHDSDVADDYKRELNIAKGESTVSYKVGNQSFSRTYFISPEPNCFEAELRSDSEFSPEFQYKRDGVDIKYTQNLIIMTGSFKNGIGFAGVVRITTDGELCCEEDRIKLTNAHYCRLYVSFATEFSGKRDTEMQATEATASAAQLDFYELQRRTWEFYGSLLGRSEINLGAEDYNGPYPTDERIKLIKEGKETEADAYALTELYWQYGRYLMIASSYRSVLPANLQGIWNADYDAIWSADYHINVNIQMNYWLTETTNLPECGDAFLRYIKFISEYGRTTARVQYGCHGWVAHTVTNPWGFTAPGEGFSWGSFMCAGAWCCEHIWERWLFSKDEKFLGEYYPVMKGACEFFLDFLVEDPSTGYLVTAPSNSPENHYRDPLSGKSVAICAGPTMDNSILYELLSNTAEAAKVLGDDADFADKLIKTRNRLPPIKIGRYGQIMEWQQDFEEVEQGHRHLSMLYGLHPSNLITKSRAPELFEASKVSITRRLSSGGGHTGWSRAWIINFYARLGMGDECEKHILALLGKSTYPNLFDAHPPFQIDGNFGGCSGVAEMLLQSHEGFIELLPALPSKWKCGSFKGLRARGGFIVSAEWENGKAVRFEITSERGGSTEMHYRGKIFNFCLAIGEKSEIAL